MALHTSGQIMFAKCHPSSLLAMKVLRVIIALMIHIYDASYLTTDEERDLWIQGNKHVPNIYMKLDDHFSSAREFKTLLCSTSNKTQLQKLLCSPLTHLAQS